MLVSPRRSYPENYSQIGDKKYFLDFTKKNELKKKRVLYTFFFSLASIDLYMGGLAKLKSYLPNLYISGLFEKFENNTVQYRFHHFDARALGNLLNFFLD